MQFSFNLILALAAGGSLYAAENLEHLYLRGRYAVESGAVQRRSAPVQTQPADTLPQQRDSKMGKVFEKALPVPIPRSVIGQSRLIGQTALPPLLDKLLTLMKPRLGTAEWYIGVAAASGSSNFYITFMALDKSRILVEPLNYERLRGEGQIIHLDSKTHYRVYLRVNFLNPVYGSWVHLDPAQATQGPSYKFKTADLLALAKKNSYVFQAGGKELWMLYSTDIDAQNNRFAQTRSIGFFRDASMNSKMWTVAEAELKVNELKAVPLAEINVVLRLLRTAADELQIFE